MANGKDKMRKKIKGHQSTISYLKSQVLEGKKESDKGKHIAGLVKEHQEKINKLRRQISMKGFQYKHGGKSKKYRHGGGLEQHN